MTPRRALPVARCPVCRRKIETLTTRRGTYVIPHLTRSTVAAEVKFCAGSSARLEVKK